MGDSAILGLELTFEPVDADVRDSQYVQPFRERNRPAKLFHQKVRRRVIARPYRHLQELSVRVPKCFALIALVDRARRHTQLCLVYSDLRGERKFAESYKGKALWYTNAQL